MAIRGITNKVVRTTSNRLPNSQTTIRQPIPDIPHSKIPVEQLRRVSITQQKPKLPIVKNTFRNSSNITLTVTLSRNILYSVAPPSNIIGYPVEQNVAGYTSSPPVCPTSQETPIRRLIIDFLAAGGTRVSYEFNRHFKEPAPYQYQLQVSETDVEEASDWTDVGSSQTNVFYLIDYTKRLYGKHYHIGYRVKLTTSNGIYYSKPQYVWNRLTKKDWLTARFMHQREILRHRLFGSNYGWLVKARRFGTPCSCVDEATGAVTDSQHLLCYGSGYGYFTPVKCTYIDVSDEQTYENRNLESVGMERSVIVKARTTAQHNITHRDVLISSGHDRRYYVHSVSVAASWADVPVVLDLELRLAPQSDIIYQLPISE